MKKIVLIFSIITLLSCSAPLTKAVTIEKCATLHENNYENILEDKFTTVIKNDTIQLNEIKFLCVSNSFYLSKGMFDKFGKWHQTIHPKGKRQFVLWEKVKLFPDDTTKFTIATRGDEGVGTRETSVLVFDENNKDLLSENSKYKSKLIAYFSELIHTEDKRKKDFYELYWKEIDPAHWKVMERNRRISKQLGYPTDY